MKSEKVWAPSSKYLDVAKVNVVNFHKHNMYELNKVDTIIHCAAYTDVPAAESNRSQCTDVNILGTRNIAELANLSGAKVVYISTDYVYPGTNGNYREDSITSPVNFYGFTKLAAEGYMTDNDLIIRTSFKPSVWPHLGAFVDLYSSADYVDVIAEMIAAIVVKTDECGILNIGTETKTIFDLAARRNPDVVPLRADVVSGVNMPEDISMNVNRFNKIYNSLGDL